MTEMVMMEGRKANGRQREWMRSGMTWFDSIDKKEQTPHNEGKDLGEIVSISVGFRSDYNLASNISGVWV